MENMQINDKWTKFTKELVESTDKIDSQYPVALNSQLGTITMLGLEPKNRREVKAEIGKPGEPGYICLAANIETYEWEEELANKTKKKRTTDLLQIADIPLHELLETLATVMEIAEAGRKSGILNLMTRDEITRLNMPSTGLLLADQLTNTDGIGKDLDVLIKKAYGSDPNALNAAIRDYESDKFAMSVKDKFIAKIIKSYCESLRFLATVVKNKTTVSYTSLEKSGAEPTLVKQQEEKVRSIASVGVNRVPYNLKQIL